jgi:2,4-dienoyl-CoA reductase-like NADH-dependent reductase (Old Yellow Enzyme family)
MAPHTPTSPDIALDLALAVIASSDAPILLLNGALTVVAASRSFCRVFQIDPATIQGRALSGIGFSNVAETFPPMTSAPIIVNTGFDKAKANAVLASGNADLVAFGVPYIAKPDLVERFRTDAPLNKPDPATFYGIGPKGYTDYPVLVDAVAA